MNFYLASELNSIQIDGLETGKKQVIKGHIIVILSVYQDKRRLNTN